MPAVGEILLSLASDLYGSLAWCRNSLYDRRLLRIYKSKLPVISVGNVTCGGNGKTPLCISIAAFLAKQGLRPVILSRGYGGRIRGPALVEETDGVDRVGDEPLLMAESLGAPVVVSRRRSQGARFIEKRQLGGVIILDDGFQHRALARDLEIIAVDVGTRKAIEAFLRAEQLPLGRFRENRGAALERADVIVLSERKVAKDLPPLDPRLLRVLPERLKVFRSFMRLSTISALNGEENLNEKRVVAFCGLANSDSFFESLCSLGYTLVGEKRFPDHYCFLEQDLAALRKEYPGYPLVCSEKDAIKLRKFEHQGVYCVRTETVVVPEGPFFDLVMRTAGAA
jgi:tetraacyldisaccharide 4'-kinase